MAPLQMSVVECRALENVARSLNDAAAEQDRLRGVTREIADFAATQLKGKIERTSVATRQLLEDVQASLHDSIAGDSILKSYSDETKRQFGAVIRTVIDSSVAQVLTASQKQMETWMKGVLTQSIHDAQDDERCVVFQIRRLSWRSNRLPSDQLQQCAFLAR